MLYKAYSVTHNDADAEEILSDIVMQFMEKKIVVKNYVNNPRAYLASITRNAALDFLKKQKIMSPLEDCENIMSDDSVKESINKMIFYEIISELDPVDQDIMLAHIGEHTRFAKIADEMNIPKSTVATRYYRALYALRKAHPEWQIIPTVKLPESKIKKGKKDRNAKRGKSNKE